MGSNDFGGKERKKKSASADKENDTDAAEAKRRAILRRRLFGGDEEEVKASDEADKPSPVVKKNKKLEAPKKSLKDDAEAEPKGRGEAPKPSRLKYAKRTHRDAEFEDTTHDLARGDEKETSREKMSDFDKGVADSHK